MLIALFGGDGEDDRFRFGIGLRSEAGFDARGGDEDDILHQAQFFKNPDEPSGGVRLRPVHAVTGGTGEGVVVIVPAFTHGQDAKEEIVSASIGCFKGAATEGVADRVDRPGDVLVHEEANETTPNKSTKSTDQN